MARPFVADTTVSLLTTISLVVHPQTQISGPAWVYLRAETSSSLKIHTAEDGSQWVLHGDQWVRYESQRPHNMEVDSPRHNPYPPTQAPVQSSGPEQYHFSVRPVLVNMGPPQAPPSHVSDMQINPQLLPLPNDSDRDLTEPASIARAKELVPASKKMKKRKREGSPPPDPHDSDTDDTPAAPKRGRLTGAPNYSKGDVKVVLDLVQKHLPSGSLAWQEVHRGYNRYCRANNRPKRDVKSLEQKDKGFLKQKKPTGEGVCPPEIKRAHKIEAMINNAVGARDVSDAVVISSDPPTPPATTKTAAPELVDKLSCAFDPDALMARERERARHSEQSSQLFILSQQLRDAHAMSETLRNQLSIVQQHLHDAERSRDMAQLELKMLDREARRGRCDGYHARQIELSRSRSPRPRKIRCEARYPDGGACTYFVTDESDSDKENVHTRRSPQRTQIYFPSETPIVSHAPTPGPSRLPRPQSRPPTPGPSRLPQPASPGPSRPPTPSVQGDSTSLMMGHGGVELTVTPCCGGSGPFSIVFSGPQDGKGKARERYE
ncbi:hypothetical protein B0H16DRAFT_1465171 [Mycena metata]|uniref:DUF6818 domain-containing protein n=1 Tax=Mycena metata TaxID=1033252 RepID=A0AAD7ICY4_9AGAR|nr:hypothetical protein B0H16DRAFT_1465171 [Mycena metata]